MAGLPEYRVRRSRRARHLRLSVSPVGEVEVVLPQRLALHHVAPFVERHHAWLRRTLERLAAEQAARGEVDGLPQRVELAALGEHWGVDYVGGRAAARSAGERLLVGGETPEERRAALCRWSARRAVAVLPPWLTRVSEELGLPFARVTVRGQKSRWGSCSSSGTISLNRKLLFVPPQLVDYLCVHELCHMVHPNHSPRFWALVARFLPQHRALEAELREAGRHVPSWAHGG